MSAPESALVVGVGPGLGESVARRLAADGAGVGLLARSKGYVTDVAAELPAATALPLDATDEDAATTAVERTRDAHGTLDALVVNIPGPGLDAGESVAAARECWEQQVPTLLRFVDAAEADLRGGGTVVVTNSMQSKRPTGSPARAGARFALRGTTLSLADDLSPAGVQVVHLVVDGWLDKPSLRERYPDHDRWTDPDAVADTIAHVSAQPTDAMTHELDLRARGDDVRS
jgi:NAD(P)-dependent dehydrogenase (short-subunit alcohol dehydrogenase family)